MIQHKDKFSHITKKKKIAKEKKTKAKTPAITKPTIKNKFYYKKK